MDSHSHSQKEDQTLLNRNFRLIEYTHNQRIFLIGQPLPNQFNNLICGYSDADYGDILKNKTKRENL